MDFAVPREQERHEHRVGLTPFGAAHLIERGHRVFVQSGAGRDSHFKDRDYTEVGASIVYSADEVYGRSTVVCQVGPVTLTSLRGARLGGTICGFLHVSMANKQLIERIQEQALTLIGYEVIEDKRGERPIRMALSEIAGQMSVHIAAHLLQYEQKGRGLLLGGLAGIPPVTVLILGAGQVGTAAARLFVANGASVVAIDKNVDALRQLRQVTDRRVTTIVASPSNFAKYSKLADILVGAPSIPGDRVPHLITDAMVADMKAGSVIIDLSVDEGGCIETSRPTTLDNPTFRVHNVTHYCVPNLTANTPRIVSKIITSHALPRLEALGQGGVVEALRRDEGLQKGVYFYRGKATHARAASALGVEYHPLNELLGEQQAPGSS